MRLNVSEQVKLTPLQIDEWSNTLTAFSWTAACFTHLLYELLNPDRGHMVATFLGEAKVPKWFIAGTNGKRLFLVADRYFKCGLDERIALLAHEVGHPMLGHIIQSAYYRQIGFIDIGFKHMPYDDMLANVAQDLVINDMIVDSRIGKITKDWLWDPKIATFRDSWIDVYERLLEEQAQSGATKPCEGGQGGQQGGKPDKAKGKPQPDEKPPEDGQEGRQRHGQEGFDAHMGFGEGEPNPGGGSGDPNDEHVDLGMGDTPITAEDVQREMARAQQAVAAAVELGRARGDLPNAFKMMCEKLLEPVVDWKEHIKAMFARKLGAGGYDFRRPDRRFLVRDIIVPGRSGHGANLVILGGDSSGSIYAVPKLTDTWMGECGGIMEDVNPREVRVLWCDAAIQRIDIIEDMNDVHKMVHDGAVGGGGTDFRPVFQYIEDEGLEPDCVCFLTDGDGQFPEHAPKFPVIWGDISGNPDKYPFGDVVFIPTPKDLNK